MDMDMYSQQCLVKNNSSRLIVVIGIELLKGGVYMVRHLLRMMLALGIQVSVCEYK